MKIQIQGQQIRFRIDEAELAVLLVGAQVANETSIARGIRVCHRVELHADEDATFEVSADGWRLRLPDRAVRAHVCRLPCKEALVFELALDQGVALAICFEVDVRDSLQVRGVRRRSGSIATRATAPEPILSRTEEALTRIE